MIEAHTCEMNESVRYNVHVISSYLEDVKCEISLVLHYVFQVDGKRVYQP